MTYANFRATVKKVNIKPKEVKEIVIQIVGDELDGQLEAIASMVDFKVNIELDAAEVVFKRKINKATNEPLTSYTVTPGGIVEIKQPDQLELEGMPKEQHKTIDEEVMINREIIDEFVLSGLSPDYDDYHPKLLDILKRRIEGESYRVLAKEYGLETDEIVEQIKLYRMQCAPLAEAWWSWKQESQ